MACQVSSNDSSCVFSLAEEKGLLFALSDNQLFCVGQSQDPVAEGMPLGQLVILAGIININQRLIVEGAGSHLVVAGGEAESDRTSLPCS